MDAVIEQDPLALQTQLAEARARLEDVVRDLHAIDGELAGLATEREQHRLLQDICGSLPSSTKWAGRVSSGGRARLTATVPITCVACAAAWKFSRSA
jgi:hypothetical protein